MRNPWGVGEEGVFGCFVFELLEAVGNVDKTFTEAGADLFARGFDCETGEAK